MTVIKSTQYAPKKTTTTDNSISRSKFKTILLLILIPTSLIGLISLPILALLCIVSLLVFSISTRRKSGR